MHLKESNLNKNIPWTQTKIKKNNQDNILKTVKKKSQKYVRKK